MCGKELASGIRTGKRMEIIPCTQATFLMSKKEERALTLSETFQLYIHLMICEFCRRFLKQMNIISKGLKWLSSNEILSPAEKQKMKESLNVA